ncbi:MAG: hypothetical protein ACJ8F7_10595, partial [Gemmataceae bacterium]
MTTIKSLAAALLAGIVPLTAAVCDAHGQAPGMFMHRPHHVQFNPVLVNPTLINPTTINTLPTVNPFVPINSSAFGPAGLGQAPTRAQYVQALNQQRLIQGQMNFFNPLHGYLSGNNIPSFGPGTVLGNPLLTTGSMYGAGYGYNPLAYGSMYGAGYGSYGYPSTGYSDTSMTSYSRPREYLPSTEPSAPRNPVDELVRIRDNPADSEILSGRALNDVLADIRKLTGGAPAEAGPALPADTVRHLNVARGSANVAVLKNDGQLSWPAALSGPEFQAQRDRISKLARSATEQARSEGRVDAGVAAQLSDEASSLQGQLGRLARNFSFDEYQEAKAFVRNLSDAAAALSQPNAGALFAAKTELRAATVPELVKQMTAMNLQFGPAASGDEAAYRTAFKDLADYDRMLRGDARPVPASA